MTQVFVNNFRAEITQTFGESDTYLTVDSTAGFPTIAPGNYALLTVFRLLGVAELGHEVVKVTAVNANMFTVERSVEGATASQFEVGDVVEARLTAGSMASKQDKEVGKGLSTNDFSTADKDKLAGVEVGATNYQHPVNHPASVITQDASNRFVTDAEKVSWNSKGVGDVTLTGAQTLTNKTLTGYTEKTYYLSGTDIAVANGSIQTTTLSANTTFTESLANGQSVILGITTGGYSVTWPSITWVKVGGGGVAPTLTSPGRNWVVLWQVNGAVLGSFMGAT